MRWIAILALAAGLAGCATQRPERVACQLDIQQQNDLAYAEIERHFGKPAHGYNWMVKAPRTRDARGDLVLEGHRIYPITLPEPEERPEGRKLTVVVDPCARRVVRAFEPAA